MHTPALPRPARLLTVIALLGMVAACAPTSTTSALRAAEPEYAPGWNGVAVEDAPALPDVDLVDTGGEPFDLRRAAADKPTLVYFGYTHCPDICPVHMANIASAMRNSPVRPDQFNVVFVTTDPDRDTPEALDAYLGNFHASFIGLTGSAGDIDDLVGGLGLPKPVLEKASESQTDEYTVGHPGQVLAFDRDGRARIAYPFGTRQSQWVEDLPKLVREDWS
ncbi:MAG TPA: SCO family protein [Euzebyales bacterium]|nr:SCO family protein [Euzebyales bacterium]